VKKMDASMPVICFLLGMWTMALIASAAQGRGDSFVALLIAPFIAGAILFLINYFGLKWINRRNTSANRK
jgi:hypothetical protein